MSKGTQYLLALAATGGAVYWYDQNVLEIFPRQQRIPPQPASTGEKINRNINRQVDKLDTKKNELVDKVSNFTNEQQREAQKASESTLDSIKNSRLVNSISGSANDSRRRIEANVDQDKNVLYKLTDKYIDLINDIGGSTTSQVDQLKSTAKSDKKRAEDKANSWFNWFGDKKDETANNLDNNYDQAKRDAEKKKNEWFSWGSQKKDEVADRANEEAEKLKKEKNAWSAWGSKKTDEVADKAAEEKNAWTSWGSKKADEATDKANQEAERLRKEKDAWSSWGSKKADEAADRAEAEKNAWTSWGSKKADEATDKANQEAERLRKEKDSWTSWGSKKADEATDKFNEETERLRKELENPNEAGKSAAQQYSRGAKNSEKAFGDAGEPLTAAYVQGRERAIGNYEAAKKNLEDLTNKANANVKSLFQKAEPTSDEKLKQAQEDFNSALHNLRSYGGDVVEQIESKFRRN